DLRSAHRGRVHGHAGRTDDRASLFGKGRQAIRRRLDLMPRHVEGGERSGEIEDVEVGEDQEADVLHVLKRGKLVIYDLRVNRDQVSRQMASATTAGTLRTATLPKGFASWL